MTREEIQISTNLNSLKEKQVQELIADFPWLLSLDYENVPNLKNKGMEYRLSDSKRADLILKDRKSGRPVIVEFKAVPFYRENIGQILEYRARIISECTKDTSILKEIFEDRIYSPIMILVVPECSPEARLACNLSNIEIYEYDKTISEFIVPEKRETLEEFIKNIDVSDLPFTDERFSYVDEIYNKIRDLLFELDLNDGWKKYRAPSGEYYFSINHLFINKNLFENNQISIGIYENIFSKDRSKKITIEYFCNDKKLLSRFVKAYQSKYNNSLNISKITEDDGCFYCNIKLDKKEFLQDVAKTLKPIILDYKDIMKNSLKLID
ncbi:hypothetical protein FDC62_08205 [Clostridium botulinum]|uniref:hypothetical protein n=1 Tax=Clostridium botulinum TaxID=1491 RepID=UPI0004DA3CBC|nr:hypothetical protein [Clostridium botulinum]KEH96909.1 hypothetical protein Z953_13690 [Clostridium botulinum D str. 16868]KGM92927.1 hypothetical protein Z956_13045 [Clostridium botulinum D str. CCUG 7971]KOC49948.1 hypothetical protein ADU88_04415 [Clostridium botulinum]MCD3351588.1 hypothetical protein [Clostridium botulinum D/C]MCD3360533.1 hypothetical protein [Clostridium botulinum D/C]